MLCTMLLQLCVYVKHVTNDGLHGTNVVSERREKSSHDAHNIGKNFTNCKHNVGKETMGRKRKTKINYERETNLRKNEL